MDMKLSSSLFILLSFYPFLVSCEDHVEKAEFSYVEGSSNGPKYWGRVRPEWVACSNGTTQSPIDIIHANAIYDPRLKSLKARYEPAHATLANSGHDIGLEWEKGSAGAIHINGTQFLLEEFHWHSPSEHTLDGYRYELEMHMVHRSADGRIAVVAMIYKVGLQDHFLLKVMDEIDDINDEKGSEEKVGLVNPDHAIDLERESYYRYFGSLTTPSCDEGVTWTVIKEVKTVSKAQLGMLRAAVEEEFEKNARPIQPLNQRQVYLFKNES
ncbi:alpha carbonic anhydrase 5 [Amborella trichopoda]|uniref:alpha carbonic anhydrase 5 n=1 Tax=Amborella trichopoda TaxID=13333 RepID=UPI0009C0A41D|nr:alpha carbonic anhydrase 5 [Amborella trichopoda]|eukprot:XP_020523871.1 alpha carbonic anhydrase 5 [Amborella trichopoda]